MDVDMNALFGSLVAIVFIVIAVNFIMLFYRFRRDFPKKPGKKAMDEAKAVIIRDKAILQMIEREQEEAIRRTELQNKTLDLYAQVRKRAEERDKQELNDSELEQGH